MQHHPLPCPLRQAAARPIPNGHSLAVNKLFLSLAGLLVMAGNATAQPATPSLKDAFRADFPIGVAVNQSQFSERDPRGNPIILAHFNSISPENVLKWESVHPRADGYAFDAPDQYVKFGEDHQMLVVGHTLVWHSQTPRWVFLGTNGQALQGTNAADREFLLQRMRDHIQTVVGRYKGRIKIWDVVNEALDEDGTLRQSPWMRIIGEDYIAKAFQYAHEADPDAILRYNDYSLENEAKRNGALALIKKLQAQGVPVTSIGLQGHCNLSFPTAEQEDATIAAFANLGLQIMITELDIDCSSGGQRTTSADVAAQAQRGPATIPGALSEALQQQLATRYSDLFGVFIKYKKNIKLVTFWGVTDADSWRRNGNPLLFDRTGQPKPAFNAVVKAAGQ
jgi:endo-1,4-beta-xylanase